MTFIQSHPNIAEVPVIGLILGAAASLKIGYAAAGSLSAAAGYSAFMLAQTAGGGDLGASTVIPATALTATSGALVYVVKKIAGGELVHRDPAAAEAEAAKAAADLAAIAAAALKREETLTQLLIAERNRPNSSTQDKRD